MGVKDTYLVFPTMLFTEKFFLTEKFRWFIPANVFKGSKTVSEEINAQTLSALSKFLVCSDDLFDR